MRAHARVQIKRRLSTGKRRIEKATERDPDHRFPITAIVADILLFNVPI